MDECVDSRHTSQEEHDEPARFPVAGAAGGGGSTLYSSDGSCASWTKDGNRVSSSQDGARPNAAKTTITTYSPGELSSCYVLLHP
jgi:hypothetical protein